MDLRREAGAVAMPAGCRCSERTWNRHSMLKGRLVRIAAGRCRTPKSAARRSGQTDERRKPGVRSRLCAVQGSYGKFPTKKKSPATQATAEERRVGKES